MNLSTRWFTQPDQVHLNELGDSFDTNLWYDHLLRYDRDDLCVNLSTRWFTQPDQVHLNELGDSFDTNLWYDHLLRYDRDDLEQNLDTAWGPGWYRII